RRGVGRAGPRSAPGDHAGAPRHRGRRRRAGRAGGRARGRRRRDRLAARARRPGRPARAPGRRPDPGAARRAPAGGAPAPLGRAVLHRRGRARAPRGGPVAPPPQGGGRPAGGRLHPPGLARRPPAGRVNSSFADVQALLSHRPRGRGRLAPPGRRDRPVPGQPGARLSGRGRDGTGKEVVVAIEPGMSFPQIAERLHDKGVVERPVWFRLYAMHRGVTTRVRVGEYTLRDDMTPKEVLDEIIKGVEDVTVKVTIPEGL